jgi:glucose/arabinose dehydrogenase
MKKGGWIFLIVVAVLAAGLGVFWQKYKGLIAVSLPPKGDIAKTVQTEAQNATDFPLKMPAGFSISVFAEKLGAPRAMIDAKGTLLTSITAEGKVVALPDKNHDGKADEAITVLDNLDRPHGLALQCATSCRLYVAETNEVSVYDYDVEKFKATGKKKITSLPGGGRHFTRSLLPLPTDDNKLLVSVGSSCDVCRETDALRAKILILDIKTGELKPYASGLRNAVFLAARFGTKEVWATEMGRDFLGDNLPPDEINVIKEGKNYGWPICYGKNIHDAVFDKNVYVRNPCMEPFETPSTIDLPAHSAPLGLGFAPASWPEKYRGDIFVAYHGSWNSSIPTGYKIVSFHNGVGEDFISGWLTAKNEILGRPAGLIFKDNAMYVSDDKAGAIYKINPSL